MAHNKKSPAGRRERAMLIGECFGQGALAGVRARFPLRRVGHDDIHDAFAALWTAERIAAAAAQVLPKQPPLDAAGLRMEIWY